MFRRSARKRSALVAVAAMLFAQFVMAAHACEAIAGAEAAASAMAAPAHHGDSPCHEVGSDQLNLCVKHCQDGRQSVDHQPASPVAPALVLLFTLAPSDASAVSLNATQRYTHALLARVTAPPLAVRHCCFRT